MDKPSLLVEVAYALPGEQVLLSLQVPVGTTLREAVLLSGLNGRFPALDLATAPLGVFGKVVSRPEGRVLQEGDRVEIYRPLLADPKEVRKRRAARAAEARAMQAGQ